MGKGLYTKLMGVLVRKKKSGTINKVSEKGKSDKQRVRKKDEYIRIR